jgi:hypothetical protein
MFPTRAALIPAIAIRDYDSNDRRRRATMIPRPASATEGEHLLIRHSGEILPVSDQLSRRFSSPL